MIATGVTVRRLEVPGVEGLEGAGVYYGAALTEAANYRGRPIYVIQGPIQQVRALCFSRATRAR